ncbi:DUF948 domain-containing protein [Bacillus atrophaeus]|uniref:DUF948 domain-containing protein n=1 Tax=Bacillus atrophaeus (strain 1942) TaxID=720555 RepID=A0ABN3Z9I3_BACA1|nr:hypothetical protein [Bacillus atrophaeus]AMR62605.1 hypothetical protein A1D11_09360 [Bacillus subtilis subsp. globigii]ADP32563.1 hypothetical protein BATR1942_08140 [Bacillus atrophaeus 1942]AIK46981.1 hypothetical protein DJ95_1518 [Bacillus atrophaeus subsp. globigii]EIM11977.1 hypothetical protein UY9_05232 [Bacillus atrophaeus C89]KFK83196.1 hypothetical protein DK44_2114 [Bacillus atrophaeus]
MFIVYASIALLLISVIFLGISVMNSKKKMDPILENITVMIGSMQKDVEELKTETQKLSHHQALIQNDFQYKKTTFQKTAAEIKEVPRSVNELKNAQKSNTL